MKIEGKTVLVTGANRGIGQALVTEALRRGAARVYAGTRQALAHPDARVTPLNLDVTDAAQIQAAAESIESLDILVNNAGIALYDDLSERAALEQHLAVNFFGTYGVTQAFLPQIREARGRVVFLSSIGGRVSFPLNGAYHAAKYGTEAIGDCFRQELASCGVKVAIIEPGSIDTPIWARGEANAEEMLAASPDTERLYGPAVERFREIICQTAARGIPPERVAKAIVHALEASRPRARYLVGLDAKLQARIVPLLPTPVLDWAIGKQLGLP